jgi:cobalt-zinc-cadmium efflux system membrane fusion protein
MKYIAVVFAVLLLACKGNKPQATAPETTDSVSNSLTLTKAQMDAAGIVTALPQRKSISSIFRVNGSIDVPPQNMVSVSMPLGGYLKSTHLLPGMHVNKGEVIAVLEDQQYIQLQQDYLTTQTKLSYTQAEYERQQDLNQSKASSDKQYQQAKMEYEATKVSLQALAEKLKLININPQKLNANSLSRSVAIYSPINGFVSKVNVNIGKYVNPVDVLFELVNPSDIHLNMTVFEKDVHKLFIGQTVWAYTNNEPDKKHRCEVILVSKDLSAERTVEVHCHFEDYDKTLLPGMYMNADIEVQNKNALALPEEAVVSFEGKNYVFAVTGNNSFALLPIATGSKENGFIAIENEAAFANRQIVTKGAYTLLMKLKNKADED